MGRSHWSGPIVGARNPGANAGAGTVSRFTELPMGLGADIDWDVIRVRFGGTGTAVNIPGGTGSTGLWAVGENGTAVRTVVGVNYSLATANVSGNDACDSLPLPLPSSIIGKTAFCHVGLGESPTTTSTDEFYYGFSNLAASANWWTFAAVAMSFAGFYKPSGGSTLHILCGLGTNATTVVKSGITMPTGKSTRLSVIVNHGATAATDAPTCHFFINGVHVHTAQGSGAAQPTAHYVQAAQTNAASAATITARAITVAYEY